MVTSWAYLLFTLTIVVSTESQVFKNNPTGNEELRDIRKRWGAADVVRDLEHIKEDIKKITTLQDTGEISTNEALFYFLRMHDFDDNRKLDGHELMAAMRHSVEHDHHESEDIVRPNKDMSFAEIESIVDSFFAYDDNMDGFISYPELRRHLSPSGEGSQTKEVV